MLQRERLPVYCPDLRGTFHGKQLNFWISGELEVDVCACLALYVCRAFAYVVSLLPNTLKVLKCDQCVSTGKPLFRTTWCSFLPTAEASPGHGRQMSLRHESHTNVVTNIITRGYYATSRPPQRCKKHAQDFSIFSI